MQGFLWEFIQEFLGELLQGRGILSKTPRVILPTIISGIPSEIDWITPEIPLIFFQGILRGIHSENLSFKILPGIPSGFLEEVPSRNYFILYYFIILIFIKLFYVCLSNFSSDS